MKQKTILVTGIAGFIGNNFAKQFKKQFPKIKVIGIDDFSTGRRDVLPTGIIFYEGSICDEKFIEGVFKKHKPTYVFHFAALPRVSYSVLRPAQTTLVNIYGTVVLLEKSRDYNIRRFIYSSSSAVYGDAKELPTSEKRNAPSPQSPYALQKYAGEPFCKMFSDLFGLDTVSLRYFNVFGPGQYGDAPYSTVVSAWLEGLFFKKAQPFLEGDGKQTRDFCYVDNVVQANIKAMQVKESLHGEVFNIASGSRISLQEVKRLIEHYTGEKLQCNKKPSRKGDVRHTHADISKAKKKLGYSPTVDFKTGLVETIHWFKRRRN